MTEPPSMLVKVFFFFSTRTHPKTPLVNIWISAWIVCIRSIFMLIRMVFSVCRSQKFMAKYYLIEQLLPYSIGHIATVWMNIHNENCIASLILLIFQYTKHFTSWIKHTQVNKIMHFTHEHKYNKLLFCNPFHFISAWIVHIY